MQPPVVASAELRSLTTRVDVKGNRQSSGVEGYASSHQATAVQRDWELGHLLDEVPMHGQLPVVG